jgi:hypothetical protein
MTDTLAWLIVTDLAAGLIGWLLVKLRTRIRGGWSA